MNITLCSSFRNSTSYLSRYFCQIRALNNLLEERGDSLSLVLGEGDSTDGTRAHLGLASMSVEDIDCRIIDVSHHGPVFGSVVDAQRFKQLAYVCNKLFSHIPNDTDVLAWIESDLRWESSTVIALIDRLKEYPCITPMIMETSTGGFYDVYAHRKGGVHFQKHEPYFDGWPTNEMTKLTSAGSALVMNADLARHLIWPEEDVVVGLCRNIYQNGCSVWLDPTLSIIHD